MSGHKQLAPYWNFIVAQVEYDNRRYNESLSRLDTFIEYGLNIGEVFCLPELYRLKALCIHKIERGNSSVIADNFNKACKFADKIGANLFKLRAQLDYYRIAEQSELKNDCITELDKTVGFFREYDESLNHHEVKEALKIVTSIF